jgi:hypothetical protein
MSVGKPGDKVEAVLTIAAVWLAFRGQSADSVAARALGAARAAEQTRERLEAFVMNNVRRHVGCRQPEPCDCLVCQSYEEEHRLKAKAAKKPERSASS